MPKSIVMGALMFFSMSACIPDFTKPPDNAQIACTDNSQCPDGWVCRNGMCVKTENLDSDPPKIVGDITVEPALLKAGATATIMFEVSEALVKDPELSIKLGGSSATITGRNIGGNKYEYAYTAQGKGVEPEEINCPITVLMTDKAMNTNEARASLVFDFTPPEILASSANKQVFKDGDTILYTVNVSKQLAERPRLEVFRDGAAVSGFEAPFYETMTSFTYAMPVTDGMDGAYTVNAELADKAGNVSSDIQCGGWRVDSLKPGVAAVSVASGNIYDTGFARTGDVVSAVFSVDKELLGNPLVTIGGSSMIHDSVIGGGPFTYTYKYTVLGNEGDGDKAVTVTVVDLAGNTAVEDVGRSTFDFTAPDYKWGTSIVYLVTDFPGNPVVTGDSVTNGTTVILTFSITEELFTSISNPEKDSPRPRAVACNAAECDPATPSQVIELDLQENGTSGGTFQYKKRISGLDADVSFTSDVYMIPAAAGGMYDRAGNVQTKAVKVAQFQVNTTRPSAPDVAKVHYRRVPWGQRDQGKNFVEKNFSVVCYACQFSPDTRMVLVYDSPSTVPGGLIGSVTSPGTRSPWSFDKIALSGSDRAHVWMAVADTAGNVSPAVEIKSAEWVATMGYKVPGSTLENPHTFLTNGLFSKTLNQFGGIQEPAVFEINPPKHVKVNQIGQGIWSEWGRSAAWPSARSGHAMAYDSARGKMVLFGGGPVNNETWEWDGTNWTQLNPATKPSARFGHAMAYNSARRKMMLFGGDPVNNETWEWDGINWTQLNPATKPSARVYHAMVYDSARGMVVMFGGNIGGTYSNETWEWDGTNWTQLSSATKPSARFGHAMAYDSARGKVVLFGGDTGSYNDETWEWDGTNWIKSNTATKPSARVNHAMAYDSAKGKVMMFGGHMGLSLNYSDETWEWDGTNWTQLSLETKPSARAYHAIAYDSARGKMVLFGGDLVNNETWEWDGTNWMLLSSATKPSGRAYHAIAYDNARGKMVLFGGYDIHTNSNFNDTWEWDGTNWTQKFPVTSPPAMSQHVMTYDSMRGKVFLCGGSDYKVGGWEWDGGNWTQKSVTSGPCSRSGSAMAFDKKRGVAVLFGGRLLNDTWEWNGGVWTQKIPATVPPLRQSHALAYDAARGEVVLLGGKDSAGNTLNDTWGWDGTDWKQKETAAVPPARPWQSLAYDSARKKVVLIDGKSIPSDYLSDTWEWDGTCWERKIPESNPLFNGALAYDSARSRVVMSNGSSTWEWDGENWTKKSPVSKPPPRLFPALTFDSIREKVVLFGEKAFLNPLNDTWEWDGVDWTQKFPAASPPGRNAFALTYDDAHGRALLFGGYDESNETNLNDTWEWDGVDWAQKFPLASPSKRSWHGLAYDSIRGRVVLFGPTETWEWDGAAWMQKFPAMSPPVRSNHALTFDGARGKVVLFGGSIGSIYLDDTWEWDGQGRGYPGQQVAVAVMSTGVIGGDASADIKQVYIKFISGGAGYPQGVVTNGVNLLAWYDDQWQVLASNSDGPKTPGLVEWTTTDAAAIKKLMLNPKQAFNFAVVPQAPNGFGHPNCPSDWTAEECDMGMVSTEYVEVTLRYTLP